MSSNLSFTWPWVGILWDLCAVVPHLSHCHHGGLGAAPCPGSVAGKRCRGLVSSSLSPPKVARKITTAHCLGYDSNHRVSPPEGPAASFPVWPRATGAWIRSWIPCLPHHCMGISFMGPFLPGKVVWAVVQAGPFSSHPLFGSFLAESRRVASSLHPLGPQCLSNASLVWRISKACYSLTPPESFLAINF